MIGQVAFVALGGFAGAIARFAVSGFVKKHLKSVFPFATLGINVLGSFILGYLTGVGVKELAYYLLCVGFLGAFTTFSTWSLESIQLLGQKKYRFFFCYVLGTFSLSIAAAFLGYLLGS